MRTSLRCSILLSLRTRSAGAAFLLPLIPKLGTLVRPPSPSIPPPPPRDLLLLIPSRGDWSIKGVTTFSSAPVVNISGGGGGREVEDTGQGEELAESSWESGGGGIGRDRGGCIEDEEVAAERGDIPS